MSKYKYTDDYIRSISEKYKTRGEFAKNDRLIYQVAIRRGILDDMCCHMKKVRTEWTEELARSAAMKCKTITEFNKKYYRASNLLRKLGVFDEATSHMTRIGNNKNRCIYVCIFPDKSIYVGLTGNLEKRHHDRLLNDNDAVTIHSRKTGLNYDMVKITGYINYIEASEKEQEYVSIYEKDGWNVLNRVKAGGLGGGERIFKYSESDLIGIADGCTTRGDLRRKDKSAYDFANNHGHFNGCLKRLLRKRKPYTFNEIENEAKKFKSRLEFSKNSDVCYQIASRKGWLNDVCKHMVKKYHTWNMESITDEASKYSTKTEFKRGCGSAYNAASRLNILNNLFS